MIKWAFRIVSIGFLTLACGGLAALLGHRQWLLSLGIAIAVYFLAGFALKTFAQRAFLVPLKLKGQVLQGAELRIHSIKPTEAPTVVSGDAVSGDAVSGDAVSGDAVSGDAVSGDAVSRDVDPGDVKPGDIDTDDEAPIPRAYYHLDVTITPAAPPGKMSHWEPSELLVVPLELEATVGEMELSENTGFVEDVEIFDGTQFVADDPGKYEGPQRLRLLVAVDPALRQAKLCYFFESFGRFELG